MSTTDDLVERLDLMVATLKLAHASEIEKVRQRVRGDKASAAIVDETENDWVKSGDLQKKVTEVSGTPGRTVRTRLQELLSLGALRQRGAGPATAYRSSGLL
jgi:hypothetical protein